MILENQARRQFEQAQGRGWLKLAEQIGADNAIDPALLIAIASRETNLDPKYLSESGDNGHGYGLTQVDVRADPVWVRSGKWRDAGECFLYTAGKLQREFALVHDAQGKRVAGRFRSGAAYSCILPGLIVADLWRVTIAGYNCGWKAAAYHMARSRNPDRGTTGTDYSRDVLQRADYYRVWRRERQPAEQSAGQATEQGANNSQG